MLLVCGKQGAASDQNQRIGQCRDERKKRENRERTERGAIVSHQAKLPRLWVPRGLATVSDGTVMTGDRRLADLALGNQPQMAGRFEERAGDKNEASWNLRPCLGSPWVLVPGCGGGRGVCAGQGLFLSQGACHNAQQCQGDNCVASHRKAGETDDVRSTGAVQIVDDVRKIINVSRLLF
jgi:hypothetical protein